MFRVARHTAHRNVTDCEDYHAVLAIANQWTQLKTGRDGPDFRRWANPFTFMTSCYENRVITRLDFDTKEEFAQQIEDLVKLHAMNDAWNGIDPASEHVRDRFIATGAERYMKALPILRPLPVKAGHASAVGGRATQAA
ncbi:MAG: hypothetical protein OXG72_15345 [Acidobacteria bacterium]|nr:hypothetical protein [Acidobacteriota bacterium]